MVQGLEVSGGGQGVVSHAGLVLLRHLADKTGLTGGLPGVRLADKVLDGVVYIRLDATVMVAQLDKELAEPNFKG